MHYILAWVNKVTIDWVGTASTRNDNFFGSVLTSNFCLLAQASQPNNEFIITFKKGKKTDSMRFSSDHRAAIITEAMRFRHEFGERQADGQQWFSYKLHWSDQRKSVVLVCGPTGLEQKDPGSNKLLATYFYKDIEAVAEVSDYPGGFVVIKSQFGRMHMFASEGREEIIRRLQVMLNGQWSCNFHKNNNEIESSHQDQLPSSK